MREKAMFELLFQIEASVLLWIQETLRRPMLDAAVLFYTSLGNAGIIWIVLSLVMLLFPKTRRAGILGLMALLGSLLITNLCLKPLVDRIRPYELVEGLRAMVQPGDMQSFPSGHTSAAFAAVLAWRPCLSKKWMRTAALSAAMLMGLSRLYVGVHYPTDVLGGLLAGVLSAWLAHRVFGSITRRCKNTQT